MIKTEHESVQYKGCIQISIVDGLFLVEEIIHCKKHICLNLDSLYAKLDQIFLTNPK
jgi:hypothetical protein